MFRLIDRGLLLLKFISTLGWRGVPVAWKLYVGRPGKLVCVSLPGGHRILMRKRTCDVSVFRTAFLERESDLTAFPQGALVMERYKETLARGRRPLVIVCGANTGSSSIFFTLLFPLATVVALEPAGENFELLCRNAIFHESILPIQAGIWDKKTCLRIINPTDEPFKYKTVECDPSDPGALATLTVADIFERLPDGEPLLIDIDVEGAEQALFRSNTGWIERMPLIIIELHDWLMPRQRTSATFLSLVARLRCDFVTRGENIFIFNWAVLGQQGQGVDRQNGMAPPSRPD